jgi:hypothetical protein
MLPNSSPSVSLASGEGKGFKFIATTAGTVVLGTGEHDALRGCAAARVLDKRILTSSLAN